MATKNLKWMTLSLSVLLCSQLSSVQAKDSDAEAKIVKSQAITVETVTGKVKKDLEKAAQRGKGKVQAPTYENAKKIIEGDAPAATAEHRKQAAGTAEAMNSVPGVKVTQHDLVPPTLPPIKGFHPIKRALRPIENMQLMVVKLQQQIMRLEGPIAGLNTPMVGLQKQMGGVDTRLTDMQGQLKVTGSQVTGVRNDLSGVRNDMAAVRSDIEKMRAQIANLQDPLRRLEKPISNVARPLEAVQAQLNWIMAAIVLTGLLIAVGTPVAGLLIYANRRRLFPSINERDMKAQTGPAAMSSASSSRR